MIIGFVFWERRDGDPDCIGRDLVGGGVSDFEVVFGGARCREGEGGEVGLC